MDISKLLETMNIDIHSLSIGEKLIGGLIVTIIAMAIVFIVLMLISFSINIMNRLINKKSDNLIFKDEEKIEINKNKDEGELIAIISAAIASSLNTSTSNIIVKSIVRVNSNESNWSKAGRLEKMNNFH